MKTNELNDLALIAIGASAGGPAALAGLLSGLPADFPAAIVIVQHMGTRFAQGLADWLGGQTPLTVRLAREGDVPRPGIALVAGRENHLVFTSPMRLGYSTHISDSSYLPSIDTFFMSVNRYWRGAAVGVLLTGMGRDGAEGLRRLRLGGHHTIAQDRVTSAVYGMPKAAADLDAAAEVLPPDRIATRLVQLMNAKAIPHA